MSGDLEIYDVIVAGGGSAGVAAAVASARCGARTLLLERYGCLGGAATMRNVVTYCGLYTLGENPKLVVGGVANEVVRALGRRNAVSGPIRHRGVFVTFDPEAVKVVLDDLATDAGVSVIFHAFVARAARDDDRIASVDVATHSGLRTYRARAFVDCTGEGDLAAFGGAATRYGNPEGVNLGTLGTRFGGIPARLEVTADTIGNAVTRAGFARGAVTKKRSVVARLPGSGDLVVYLASEDYDARDVASMSRAERGGRSQAQNYLDAIRTIPGCEEAHLVSTGPEFGTRESRHLECRHQLTWAEIADRQSFDDCIALGAWGAEWHDRADFESSFDYPAERGGYEIPLGCLWSRDTPNLFCAGRLADGDHRAGAAIRVMGTAMATGQAAGVAAAHYAEGTAVAGAVRDRLREQGAVLEVDAVG